MTTWIVAPIYFDVRSFIELRARIKRILPRSEDICFVAVDDTAGLDAAFDELAAFSDVRVLTCPFNLSHQRAIVFGLRQIRYDVSPEDKIITMDSDGEDRPEDLPELMQRTVGGRASRGVQITLAERTRRQESILFKVMYLIFKMFFWTLTGTTIKTGNFAILPGRFLEQHILHPKFDLCYSSTLISLGVPVTMVPCARGKRYYGSSKMNLAKLIMHGMRMLMPFLDRIATRSLILFGGAIACALVLVSAVLWIKLFTGLGIPGWVTYTVLSLITVLFVSFGNILVLFAIFSQSQGIGLNYLDKSHVGSKAPSNKAA